MTLDELNTLAHDLAYSTAKSDIESFTTWRDDRTNAPVEASFLDPDHRWYDLSSIIRDSTEREAVAKAIFYLDARQLLLRKAGEPFMVKIQAPLSSGALVPPSLAEALSA